MANRSFRWIRPEIDSKWLEEWLKECGVIGSWLATAPIKAKKTFRLGNFGLLEEWLNECWEISHWMVSNPNVKVKKVKICILRLSGRILNQEQGVNGN